MNLNFTTPNKTLNISDSYYFNTEKNSNQDLKTAKDSRSPSSEETENTQNLISRKTKRGRKEKIPLPKNKLKCEVCLEFFDFSKKDLISCSTCKCLFHKLCYDQYEINPSSIDETSKYKCMRCSHALKLNKPINEIKCFICGLSNGVLNKNSLNGLFYHKICKYFLNEFNNLEEEDICKEKIKKWRYKNSCKYCGEKLSKDKAVIKCKNPKCKEYYHIACALEKGMIFDLNFMKKFYNVSSYDEISFYCSNHNKKLSFMYKTTVVNNNNDNKCKKNLFQTKFNIDENNEKITYFKYSEDLHKKKFIENKTTIFGNIEEKDKINFMCKNSDIISIIEEENINDKNNENCWFQNENEELKNKNIYIDINNYFKCYNNYDNFSLNFENNINKNNECLLEDNFYSSNHYLSDDFVSNLSELKKDNEFNLSRNNSFNSLFLKY